MNPVKNYILLFLKGIAMGSADAVPGVSGGTIALLTGIYERLLGAIQSISPATLRLLLQGKFRKFWKKVDGTFLIVLLTGIALSLLSFARLITKLLISHPIHIWSFFFGLILISSYLVGKRIKHWNILTILTLGAGAAIAYGITVLTPAQTPEAGWFIFLSGAIAVCAMILPGISGSFILLMLGKYHFMMEALKAFDLKFILIFMAGAVTGLLSFSRLIHWMLKHFHDLTIGLLTGFMIGSLNKVWPWKEVLATRINSKGLEVPLLEKSVLPQQYEALYQKETFLVPGICIALLAIAAVYGIEFWANKKQKTA
ncbi:MAG: DUF368 domain-containing protein [Cytophagales bacterium]|nr:DUF368 domain-containing protein [Cytophagales bacterium]